MLNMSWFLCVVVLISVNLGYAEDVIIKGDVTSTPDFIDHTNGVGMVYVMGGCYQMGASDHDCDANPEERPAHEVCLNDFYMGKYEVTQKQWKTIMGGIPSSPGACSGDDCPVVNVSWDDVQEFIFKLNSRKAGSKFRLPTEAEWEFAAKSGGKDEKYSGGNNLHSVAWFAENSGRKSHPVGMKKANGLGIYDMTGNVWEWTSDWYASDYYKSSPRTNPSGPKSGVDRVIRGGCALSGAPNQRTTRRTYISERSKGKERSGNVGFRLLMMP